MNTVRTEELIDNGFNKSEASSKDRGLHILVSSNNQYLIGIFQVYCQFSGCRIKKLLD